jgi:hypothetical protein
MAKTGGSVGGRRFAVATAPGTPPATPVVTPPAPPDYSMYSRPPLMAAPMRGNHARARRRCQGEPGCLKPIVMSGPNQTGVYYTSDVGGQLLRRPLCWQCYDIFRGNRPRPSAPREWG